MIQKMKKLTFLVYHKEYNQFLKELQNLGVVHLQNAVDQSAAENAAASSADALNKLQDELQHVNAVISSMAAVSNIDLESIEPGNASEAAQYIAKADELDAALAEAKANEQKFTQDVEVLGHWGSFSKDTINKLENAGVHIHYHTTPAKSFDSAYAANLISTDSSNAYFVTFTQGEEPDEVEAETVQLPAESLDEAVGSLAECRESIDDYNGQIIDNAEHIYDVVAYSNTLVNRIEFAKAEQDTAKAAGGKVMVVEGWFPVNKEADVEAFLKKADTYYEIREPEATDNVPIKFENGFYSSMFERLTKMYGFPCYNEWDPTPIVAPFFTLFFAICMGDAGYGIIIAIYGLFGLAGKTKKVPIIGEMLSGCESMIVALGVATTIIGFLLGTFFGINIVEAGWIPQTTAVGSLLAWLQGTVPGTNYSIQMAGALCIGVFHICLAMVIKAMLYTKKEGFKSQISTWGWVILLVGGIITGILALAGALTQQQMQMVLIVIGAIAAVAIYLLNNVGRLASSPIKGIIINPLAGLYDTYNMASGLMGDILSYIRIYALCLAGGMLGGAFNMIGDMVRGDSISWTIIFAILIYVIGHIFNLLMSAISAFVHPLRLNFVEYFKNAGYEGKGTGYKPFEVK